MPGQFHHHRFHAIFACRGSLLSSCLSLSRSLLCRVGPQSTANEKLIVALKTCSRLHGCPAELASVLGPSKCSHGQSFSDWAPLIERNSNLFINHRPCFRKQNTAVCLSRDPWEL